MWTFDMDLIMSGGVYGLNSGADPTPYVTGACCVMQLTPNCNGRDQRKIESWPFTLKDAAVNSYCAI